MCRRAFELGLFCAVLVMSGCVKYVVVEPRMPTADAVTQPALQRFMRSVQRPTIVLRVPSPQRQVTQSQAQQGEAEMSRAYNLIEKELVKAGFTVRDRGLLEEVLRSTQNLDYQVIEDKINAQLILEIVSIQARSYKNDEYLRVKDRGVGRLQKGAFPIDGWQFECKVVLVNSGEIGGIYTIHVAPTDNHFFLTGEKFQNAGEQGRADTAHLGYGTSPEAAAQGFVTKLISYLRPSA
jgi:hypothetical protein